jgi:RimJ/RimL family protein N-acetyltransferase
VEQYACLGQQFFELGPYSVSPVQEDHIESIRCWRNAQMNVLRQSSPISPEQQVEYFSLHVWPMMNTPRPSNILVSLFKNGDLIGYGGLVHIAWEHERAELSFLLAPNRVEDPTVYAEDFSAFLGLIKRMAFEDLKLHRIFTETYDIRPHHISLLEMNDFFREGVLRDHLRIDGRSVNSVFHGCLKQDVK